ncbi:MAG TPA: HTH domain-containing protein [Candidatus Nanoarchaeia archaeon]|nr:HTH domain-containing protein [Candidatus Nanoarchaeia archaeon]
MDKNKKNTEILKIILKQFTIKWTITSLAKEIKMSRVGIWKALKKLEAENLILLSPVGGGETSTFNILLNWENQILEKRLSLILTEDALKNQRWLNNFKELENKLDFLILYGSMMHSPREANDVDVLGVVSNKNKFKEIEEAVQKIQKIQSKKVHSENFTRTEFKEELKKKNKIFIDAIKKGVVIFGQEKFIRFIKEVYVK